MPEMRLGSIVPNFTADTTHGQIDFYNWQESSWVFFFSHPADFTPVCTSELGRIARSLPEFAKRNVKCLAHSVDDLRTLALWIADIKAYCKDLIRCPDGKIFPYPIVADPQRDLAVTFGMMDDEQRLDPEVGYISFQTLRALFLIDPQHKLRLSMFYPMSCGRNMDEVIRCIDALQLADRLKTIATPANWRPGEEVLILPKMTDLEAEEQFSNGFKKVSLPSGKNYIRTTQDY